MRTQRNSGFTLIEMMVTLALTGLLMHSITTVVRSSVGLYASSSEAMSLEARGSRAMQRLVEAMRGMRLSSLVALPVSPNWASTVDFTRFENFDGVESPVSLPIQLTLDGDSVVWIESPALADERQSRWVSGVAAMFEGETLNVADDNGNDCIDEGGLFFSLDGSSVQLGLTLQDGDAVRSWTTHVTCRN